MDECIKCLTATCMMVLLSGSFIYAEEQKEPSVAIVNDGRIFMSDLDRELAPLMASNPELRSEENIVVYRKMRREALDYLIDQEIMVQEGNKAGLKPKEAEVDAELAKLKQRFPSQEVYQQVLKQQGWTEEKLHRFIERGLTIQKVITVKIKPTAKPVTDENVSGFYEENKEKFVEPEKVNARHILIKVSSEASEQEKSDAEAEIQSILEKAKGGADFAELAKEYSQCPSASQGGDLGYFTRGQMVEPFEQAAFAMQPGQISEIVETRFGYHIIMVQDSKPEKQMKLEEVSEEIKETLYEKEIDTALKKWLKPIREEATINILLKG